MAARAAAYSSSVRRIRDKAGARRCTDLVRYVIRAGIGPAVPSS